MKNIFFTIITCILFSLQSCNLKDPNKNVDEGKIQGKTYKSKEIGWTMEIPDGWTVIDKELTEERNNKGQKALEKSMGQKVDFTGLKNLLSLQKDQFNVFQSTSEPFTLDYEGQWEETNAAVKSIIFSTYKDQGIEADTSITTIEKIDGLDFHKYSFTIYSPDGEIILNQIMYGRLINGFDFGVNINYNNNKDRDELLKVFKNSKFKLR